MPREAGTTAGGSAALGGVVRANDELEGDVTRQDRSRKPHSSIVGQRPRTDEHGDVDRQGRWQCHVGGVGLSHCAHWSLLCLA